MSPDPAILLFWEVRSPALSLVGIERLLTDDFLNKSRHPHTLCDQTCSGAMHNRKKVATGAVNGCNLPHVKFDFFVGACRRAPGAFGFINPGSAKSAGEFQPTLAAILVKHDS